MATAKVSALPAILAGDFDDTTQLYVVDKNGAPRKATNAQLRTALQAMTALSGDVVATGPGNVAATIANDAVTFAKMQNVATGALLGRGAAGSGDVQALTIGAGLVLVGNDLQATVPLPPATVAPSATLLTHRAFGGL